MAQAAVGDDGYGDDPTIAELERYAATLFGKEAALFVPTGVMGNLISVLTHCRERGSEVILGNKSHLCYYEQGGLSTLGSVHPRQLPNAADGTIALDDIRDAIRADDPHFPRTKLICLENTQNHCGGRVLPLDYMDEVGALAKDLGIPIHIDGARIMNACAALGVAPSVLTRHAASVSVCLSKGLGAPVGSVIVASADFIYHAHRLRKALGGQMRQGGVIAAPALMALRDNAGRLTEDHANARRLGAQLGAIYGVQVDCDAIDSNIVVVDVSGLSAPPDAIVGELKREGVLAGKLDARHLRVVTHLGIAEADVDKAAAIFCSVAAKCGTACNPNLPLPKC